MLIHVCVHEYQLAHPGANITNIVISMLHKKSNNLFLPPGCLFLLFDYQALALRRQSNGNSSLGH